MPDEDNLAIERRIIYFIVSLENNDSFFTKFNREKAWFLNEIKQAGVKSLTLDEIKNDTIVKIEQCKQWANTNISDFKKYVTHYCNQLESRDEFENQFIEKINIINARKGLPLLSQMQND